MEHRVLGATSSTRNQHIALRFIFACIMQIDHEFKWLRVHHKIIYVEIVPLHGINEENLL